MKKFSRVAKTLSLAVGAASILISCSSGSGAPTSTAPGGASTVTGLGYNEEDGFEVGEYFGQPQGPNLVYIDVVVR
jgi:hypothetical protein